MTKLPQEAKEYIELNLKTSNRALANEILKEFNIKTTHTTVGKEKKEILERMERKVERIEVEKPVLAPRPFTPKRIPREDYQLVNKGDLVNIIADVLQEKFEVDPKLLKRLQLGYPQMPFGGKRKTKDGGWNSISYAVFEIILASKRVYIKKEN